MHWFIHFNVYCTSVLSLACIPAGVSLATASVDTLGQGVMQTGINHIQADWLLMHLTARVPVQHTNNHKTHKVKIPKGAGRVIQMYG